MQALHPGQGVRFATLHRSAARNIPTENLTLTCRVLSSETGADIALSLLDLSQTSVRFLATDPLEKWQHLEIAISRDDQPCVVQRIAVVVMSVPAEGDRHLVGATFLRPLSLADTHRLAYA